MSRTSRTAVSLLLLPWLLVLTPPAGAGEMELSLTVPRLQVSEYHRPYVAGWIEREDGSVAAELLVWYQQDRAQNRAESRQGGDALKPGEDGRKWLPDLRQWWRRIGRNQDRPTDAVAGATPPPKTHKRTFAADHPAVRTLQPGHYRLVVEAVREVGGREVVKLPFDWPVTDAVRHTVHGRSELGEVALQLKP